MYIVRKPGMKLDARSKRVIDVCKAGGFVRYALESGYGGREKFRARVYDASHMVVPGLGYHAAHDAIALGYLESRPVPRGSCWAQEWVIKKEEVCDV